MFTIISIMFVGIGIGYVLRNLQFLQKIEKSTAHPINQGENSLIL